MNRINLTEGKRKKAKGKIRQKAKGKSEEGTSEAVFRLSVTFAYCLFT
jgi:hypothetical protein